MKTAIISGTFDPIHQGHLDIISRASHLFGKVVVAVADSHYKNEMFPAEVRAAAVKAAVSAFDNVEVEICDGLLVDFCLKYDSPVIVRGARSGGDFDYEAQMAMINSEIMLMTDEKADYLDTVILPARQCFEHISSTMIRELIKYGKDFDFYVPYGAKDIVKQALKNGNEKN